MPSSFLEFINIFKKYLKDEQIPFNV